MAAQTMGKTTRSQFARSTGQSGSQVRAHSANRMARVQSAVLFFIFFVISITSFFARGLLCLSLVKCPRHGNQYNTLPAGFQPPLPKTAAGEGPAASPPLALSLCQPFTTSALVMFRATRHPALHTSMHLPQPSHLA